MMQDNQSYEWYEKGRASLEKGELTEAIHFLQKSLKCAPHWKTYELLGICLMDAKQVSDALEVLKRGIACDATRFKMWHLLGEAHLMLQQLDDALRCWQQAIILNPQYKASKKRLQGFQSS